MAKNPLGNLFRYAAYLARIFIVKALPAGFIVERSGNLFTNRPNSNDQIPSIDY